ncbi:MAG: hypothetical protein DRO09_02890 [Thermoprotei archaeon]|nr:MAG: hypothetical protein DRO09_02890 [Thermoprotei archaeon]
MFDGKVDTIEPRWGYVLLELVVFNRAMSEEEARYLHRNRNNIDLLSRDDFMALITPEYSIYKVKDEIIVEGETGFE